MQHIEYVLFGEVFLEERNSTWNTPCLFNGKEYDSVTGLCYYGARYYNPRVSVWYGGVK
ncbi:MAG: RHS repeat-associated core domain-containing protein [Bacteroidales bacterium]